MPAMYWEIEHTTQAYSTSPASEGTLAKQCQAYQHLKLSKLCGAGQLPP